jgi:protein-S-isoprenylcysteine O-methyltransferase Ste14
LRPRQAPDVRGGIRIALGWSTIFASPVGLALTVLLALFLELRARREELWLLDRYPTYAEYRQRTPRKFLAFFY